jgi:formamidopyrimidine-DNA glycosylase
MPELPEVETVRRSLEPHILGRAIREVIVRPSLRSSAVKGGLLVLTNPSAGEFVSRLQGCAFAQLDRHGKQLVFRTGGQSLFIHLGMTGQLTFRDPRRADQAFVRHPKTGLERSLQHPVDEHTHISFLFEDGTEMHYRDIRKFGKFRLYYDGQPEVARELAKLGPDPLTPSFTVKHLAAELKATSRAIKSVLLDQEVVAGVGNIYADEALHRARIWPLTPADRLGPAKLRALHESVREVLLAGLAHGGTSLSDYVDGEGRAGTHQEQLRAYGREGLPCFNCQTAMVRIVVAQRATTFCPRCQQKKIHAP